MARADTEGASGVTGQDPGAFYRRWRSLGPRERSAVTSWAAFTATFAAVRKLTHAIKEGDSPAGDLTAGGVHVHHYLWGIALLGASGGVAIHGSDNMRAHTLVAAGYGAGGALVVDEFALLLHLKDVYWTRHGRKSVVLAVGIIGCIGASFTLIPLWRRRLAKRHGTPDAHREKFSGVAVISSLAEF